MTLHHILVQLYAFIGRARPCYVVLLLLIGYWASRMPRVARDLARNAGATDRVVRPAQIN